MKRILLLTVFLLGFGFYMFSQAVFVHWNNVSLTYNGALQAPTAFVDTMGIYIELEITGAQIDAGTYLAMANFPASYTGSFVLQNYSEMFYIASYMITVQWGSRGLTYTGASQAPSASATGVIGENLPLSISGEETNVGTGYTAYATLYPVNTNYYITHNQVGGSDTLNFYIDRATIPVVWTNTTLTYNSSPQAPTATVTGLLLETVPVSVTGAETNIGGPYTATAALSAPASLPGSNYTLSNTTTPFNIVSTPANTYTVVWSNTSLTYTGAQQAPTAVATNTFGITIAVTVTGEQTDAGTGYTATAALTVPNPAITLNNATTTFIIAPATVPVVWGDTTLIYTGSPLAPTATATGLLNEDLPLNVTGVQTNIGGPYTATAALSAPTTLPGSNYTLSNASSLFIIIEVYTVAWNNRSLTFTGYTQGPTAVATNTSGLNIAITVKGAQINAAYGLTATAALTTPNSYIRLVNATTTFNIVPATVPVQWGNTTLTYTGNLQAPTATATGVMDENLPLSVTGAQIDAGTGYTATASLNTTNNNYTLSNTTTKFEIVQPPVNIDPFIYTVLWDRTPLTYTGNPQKPTATASNELGDSIAISVIGAKTNVGIGYLAQAELTIPDGRITLLNAMMMFEIVPAPIPVQWGSTVLYYTGSPQAPTASLKDLMGEDMPLDIAGAQTNVGTGYTATAWLRTPDNNYTLTNVTILFSIVQATPYNVVWGNKSLTYNGNLQAPTATATNDQGQSVAITVTGAQINVGTAYTATAELAVPNNSIVLNNATTLFDITPAPLDIAAVSETIVYGQTPVLAYTLRSGRLFGNDALTGALSVETLQATPYPVGEYVIGQGTLAANRNYTIIFTKGTLTVIESNQFDIIVNSKSATHEGDKYYGEPAENGENQAEVYVLANPGETIEIGGQRQNPRIVALPLYGDNLFTITVTPPNGTPQNHTLIIERYYEKVYFEYPDIPTISCNTKTNGGLTFSGFQWYREGKPMEDATGQFIRVNDNATYYCLLTPDDYANVKLRTINVRHLDLNASGNLTVYPNPTQGKVTILFGVNARTDESTNGRTGESTNGRTDESTNGRTDESTNGRTGEGAKPKIQVFDLNGVLVMQPETNPFDMSILPQGMYFIRVNGKTAKVIKTN